MFYKGTASTARSGGISATRCGWIMIVSGKGGQMSKDKQMKRVEVLLENHGITYQIPVVRS